MTNYEPGDLIPLDGALDPLLMEPGTLVNWRATTGFCAQEFHGEVKTYRFGRSLVLFEADWMKWIKPEYLTVRESY